MQKYKTAIKLSFAFIVIASKALACAADVGGANFAAGSMIQQQAGGFIFLQHEHNNQCRNWHRSKKSNAKNNEDKNIKTQTTTIGG